MPQRMVFGLAFTGLAAWSLFVLVAWLMVNLGGDVLRLLAPVLFFGHPDGPSIVDAGADLLVAVGGWAVATVWLAGCAVLGLLAFVLHRLAGGVRGARFDYAHGAWTEGPARREMKDVTPPAGPTGQTAASPRRLPGPIIDPD